MVVPLWIQLFYSWQMFRLFSDSFAITVFDWKIIITASYAIMNTRWPKPFTPTINLSFQPVYEIEIILSPTSLMDKLRTRDPRGWRSPVENGRIKIWIQCSLAPETKILSTTLLSLLSAFYVYEYMCICGCVIYVWYTHVYVYIRTQHIAVD